MEIDFDGSGVNETQPVEQQDTPNNADDKDSLSGEPSEAIEDNVEETQEQETEEVNQEQQTSSTGELEPGTEVEFDGKVYTVSDNGDLLDENGVIFKNANEVQNWLDSNSVSDEDLDFSIDAIRNAIGVDVVDDNGNPIEFANTPDGVSGYVNSVLELKSEEIATGAINKLFSDVPMLREFIDYVQLTGTPRGFGEITDRSGIEVEKDNEAQQIAIIRQAAAEFGNSSINDNYIKYLKSSGALYDEAKAQLENLVAKDKATKERIAQEAERARQQEQEELTQYWQGVYNAINNRVIGGYKLPDTFVREINGQKVTLTPDDFYDYIAKATEVDEGGTRMTKYQRDLEELSDEETLNRDLLGAWLMFTGGSYKDLVDMAIKENEVRRIVVKSKQRAAKTVKVVKPNKTKVSNDDILF